MTHSPHRRFFLRAAGVQLALPVLESLLPRALAAAPPPRRMVCIGNALGFYPSAFFPKQTGPAYDLPSLLAPIGTHRKDLTILSGLDHGVKGGHFAIHSFLSGVRTVDAKGMPEGNISLDQRAAESVAGATRFPSLAIGSQDGIHGGCMMCWTRSGMRVPPIEGPKELFRKLFLSEQGAELDRARDRFRLHGSILDTVKGDAQSLNRDLGKRDQQKLDEYFTAVRDVEQQIALNRTWAEVPKPSAPIPEPDNKGMVPDLPVLYDLMALALQTDSTRILTLEIAGGFLASALGIKKDYHALSHHGQLQENIDDLLKLELYQMQQFARFLAKLKSIDDRGATLLDRTMVLFGSGMGNANSHTNSNLPVILAGGGFRHGQHKAYPQSGSSRTQLCNLFLTMLQHFGVETPRFGTSTGTLTGLETVRT
ncbi:MAG: DUF1552 domain-containing protein [Bryobacterales bacterium]|nr:DUF1552 domain-containing protein [Bryobacterales bacterium]